MVGERDNPGLPPDAVREMYSRNAEVTSRDHVQDEAKNSLEFLFDKGLELGEIKRNLNQEPYLKYQWVTNSGTMKQNQESVKRGQRGEGVAGHPNLSGVNIITKFFDVEEARRISHRESKYDKETGDVTHTFTIPLDMLFELAETLGVEIPRKLRSFQDKGETKRVV